MPFLATLRAGLILVLGLASFGAISAVSAQDATPDADPGATPDILNTEVALLDTSGNQVGTAIMSESADGVTFTIDVTGLTPGEHGIHVHEVGVCDPSGDEPFSSAGAHYNPADAEHGGPPSGGHGHMMEGSPMAGDHMMDGTPMAGTDAHAGDLGNITVGEDGTGQLVITTDRLTLEMTENHSIPDADGSALVIHADPDDLTTQPSGNSGSRIACGVLAEPMNPAVVATPVA